MADIQSATAEIRRGNVKKKKEEEEKKKKKKKKPQGKKYNGLPYSIGRP